MRPIRWPMLLACLVLAAPALEGQQPDFDRAFELERRGSYTAAAEAYRRLLVRHPADANIPLGLERTLTELGQPGEMAIPASDALRAQPADPVLYGVAVRAWTAAGVRDSARRIAERWGELDPGSEAPWREWGYAALARRDRSEAKEAFLAGRAKLGRPEVLAGELAQLATVEGNYGLAAEECRYALGDSPGYRASALALLGQVPADRRPAVLPALDGQSDPALTGVAARQRGELQGLAPAQRGRKPDPQAAEVARLQRENAQLQAQVEPAEVIIDVQKKLSQLLGLLATPSTDNT